MLIFWGIFATIGWIITWLNLNHLKVQYDRLRDTYSEVTEELKRIKSIEEAEEAKRLLEEEHKLAEIEIEKARADMKKAIESYLSSDTGDAFDKEFLSEVAEKCTDNLCKEQEKHLSENTENAESLMKRLDNEKKMVELRKEIEALITISNYKHDYTPKNNR